MCTFKTPSASRSNTSPCENRHHAHMCFNMCAWCRHTRGRLECTRGSVLNLHTGFSACHTTPQPQRHTPQIPLTDTTCTPTHNITHEREKRRRRQRKITEKEREEKTKVERQDKTREDERQDKRREKREDQREDQGDQEKMKRDGEMILSKNVSNKKNPPDESAQNVSKNSFRTNFS